MGSGEIDYSPASETRNNVTSEDTTVRGGSDSYAGENNSTGVVLAGQDLSRPGSVDFALGQGQERLAASRALQIAGVLPNAEIFSQPGLETNSKQPLRADGSRPLIRVAGLGAEIGANTGGQITDGWTIQGTGSNGRRVGTGETGDGRVIVAQAPRTGDGRAIVAQTSRPEERVEEQMSLPQSVRNFEQNNRLDIRVENGRFAYYIASGRPGDTRPRQESERLRFTTEVSEAGLREARERLDAMIRTEMNSLTQRYGVTFSTPGEIIRDEPRISNKRDPNYDPNDRVPIRARLPFLDEVRAIGSALETSAGTHINLENNTRMHFNFIAQEHRGRPIGEFLLPDREGIRNRERGSERPGVPIIDLAHNTTRIPFYSGYGSHFDTVRNLVIHEMGHHTESVVLANQQLRSHYNERLGWSVIRHPTENRELEMIRGRRENEYYAGSENFGLSQVSGEFIRVDSQGYPVDEQGGRLANVRQARIFQSKEVRELASVTPLTSYITNPREQIADSLALYRAGAQQRGQALTNSSQAYEVAREIDQREINMHYGLDRRGEPRRVRLPDGRLADNTAASRRVIDEFERRYRMR